MPNGSAGPTRYIGGGSRGVAAHFAANHRQFGRVTLAQLSVFYGHRPDTVRRGLRLAEPLFHDQGLGLCVPERVEGWVIVATENVLRFIRSTVYRFQAMSVEAHRLGRTEALLATLGTNQGHTPIIAGFADNLDSMIESLTEALAP